MAVAAGVLEVCIAGGWTCGAGFHSPIRCDSSLPTVSTFHLPDSRRFSGSACATHALVDEVIVAPSLTRVTAGFITEFAGFTGRAEWLTSVHRPVGESTRATRG